MVDELIEEMLEDINNIKEELHDLKYKPHEWFKRNRVFYESFMSQIRQTIAKEVQEGLMLHIIDANPKKVAELVKNVVEDYLNKWEIDDQIAEQIVLNTISKPEFMNKLLGVVIPYVRGYVNKHVMMLSSVADEVLELCRGVEDVLEKKARG